MPYNRTNRILTAPLNTADISQAVGVTSGDVGTLCSSTKINPFAKFKPMEAAGVVGQIPDSQRNMISVREGIRITQYTNPAQLISGLDWQATRPTTIYRTADFVSSANPLTVGYYKDAPVPLACIVDGSLGWQINSVNELADQNARVPFYAFFKSAVELADKQVDSSNGISSSSYNHTQNQLAGCIGANELATFDGDSLIGNDSRFGLALFTERTSGGQKTYTYVGTYLCKQPINTNSVYGTTFDAFCLYANSALHFETDDVEEMPTGTFVAVPCLKLSGDTFVRLARYPFDTGTIYPTMFRFGNGMTEFYQVTFRFGTSPAAPDEKPTSGFIETKQNDLYIYCYVQNTSDWPHQTTNATINNWALDVRIRGLFGSSAAAAGFDGTEIDRVAVADRISPSAFEITPGGEAVLVYHVGMIWSRNGTTTITGIPDGAALFVGFNLKYSGHTLGELDADGQWQENAQTIYYR